MSCFAPERLAAAVSGEDDSDAILEHLDICTECQQIVEEQSAMRLLVGQTATPRLSAAHRESLGAEIMARADFQPMHTRRMVPLVGAGLAVAAAVAIAFGVGAFNGTTHEPAQVATIEAPEPLREPIVTPIQPPTVTPITEPTDSTDSTDATDNVVEPRPTVVVDRTRAKLEGPGEFTRKISGDHEVVKLASGELTVDTNATTARPVHVVTGDTTLAFKRARVKVVATKGAIAQVSVFAGTAEITVNGTTQVIEAGMVWERPATPADSSTAFQEGWAALREGRNGDAIAAFDRAVDPVVAEDALYWAAIASERNGDSAGAKQRYEVLIEKFPKSPNAKKAKKALSRLDE